MKRKFILSALFILMLVSCSSSTSVNTDTNTTENNVTSGETIDDSSDSLTTSQTTSNTSDEVTTIDDTSTGTSKEDSSSSVEDVLHKVKVTLKYLNDKTADKTITYNYDEDVYGDDLVLLTRSGYAFMGWFAISNTEVEKQVTSAHDILFDYDHVVYAKWSTDIGEYTPTYDNKYGFDNKNGSDAYGTAYNNGNATKYYEEGTKPILIIKDALLAAGNSDQYNGSAGLRASKKANIQTEQKVSGLSQLQFVHTPYKAKSGEKLTSNFYIEYSVDGTVWTELDTLTITNASSTSLQSYRIDPIIAFDIYIRLRNGVAYADTAVNIDDFRIVGRKRSIFE